MPLFVTVAICAALVVPVFCSAKVRLEGLKFSVNVGTWPVPLKLNDCGLAVALSVNNIAAVREPFAVGENVTLTEHEELAVRLPVPTGHVSPEIAKSPGLAPVRAINENITGLLPVLLTVIDCAALVVRVFCNANVRLPGLKLNVYVAIWPVPVSPTDCGLPLALSVKVTAAVRVPLAVGENVMPTEHDALAARLPAPTTQVSFEMAKSPGFAPVNAIDENVTGLLPLFVTVTACAALVVPVLCDWKVRALGLRVIAGEEGTVIVPPTPAMGSESPAGLEPASALKPMATVPAVAGLATTCATTPSGRIVAFIP